MRSSTICSARGSVAACSSAPAPPNKQTGECISAARSAARERIRALRGARDGQASFRPLMSLIKPTHHHY
eukprot:1194169-Prorocentrum_minimum.AAC.3